MSKEESGSPDAPQEAEDVVAEAEAAEVSVERDFLEMVNEIEKLTTERQALQEQVLRTMADFQNFRKRTQQEAALFRQLAAEALVKDLLPVLDNFQRTLLAADSGASPEAVLDGVRMVDRQFRSVLEQHGVKTVETLGVEFDPNVHDAIGQEPTEAYPEGTVAVELESGYRMGDRVIRPARVKVASKP